MSPEVKDAIESARSIRMGERGCHRATPQPQHSFALVRAIVLAVAQELPPELTLSELCDELQIANVQEHTP